MPTNNTTLFLNLGTSVLKKQPNVPSIPGFPIKFLIILLIPVLLAKGFGLKGQKNTEIYFPVWLGNLLISAGLEPVLSQTEK